MVLMLAVHQQKSVSWYQETLPENNKNYNLSLFNDFSVHGTSTACSTVASRMGLCCALSSGTTATKQKPLHLCGTVTHNLRKLEENISNTGTHYFYHFSNQLLCN